MPWPNKKYMRNTYTLPVFYSLKDPASTEKYLLICQKRTPLSVVSSAEISFPKFLNPILSFYSQQRVIIL